MYKYSDWARQRRELLDKTIQLATVTLQWWLYSAVLTDHRSETTIKKWKSYNIRVVRSYSVLWTCVLQSLDKQGFQSVARIYAATVCVLRKYPAQTKMSLCPSCRWNYRYDFLTLHKTVLKGGWLCFHILPVSIGYWFERRTEKKIEREKTAHSHIVQYCTR